MDEYPSASNYPPGLALMVSKGMDMFCNSNVSSLFQCQNWRDSNYVPWTDKGQWFSEEYKVGDVTTFLPTMLSYSDYLETAGSNTNSYSIASLANYAVQPSTDLSVLTTTFATMVLLGLVLMLRIIKGFLLPYFSEVGRRAGRNRHGEEWEKANQDKIVKFGEYVFRLLYHTVISAIGIWYFWDKSWWDPHQGGTRNLFENYPNHDVPPGMTWYYLVQGAYNLDALLSLLELSFTLTLQPPFKSGGKTLQQLQSPIALKWSDTVRGDFREMAVHHIVTNLLVIGSSFFRLTRIGSMVFLVHDISDIPVDVSKLANFLKWKRATACGFGCMVLFWLVFRLGILPFVIYKSVLTESYLVMKHVDAIYYYTYRYFFYYLVGQIIVLHMAWFVMFLRMGYLLLKKGETHDLSEHKSGESQEAIPTQKGSAMMNGHSGVSNGHSSSNGNGVTNGHASNGNGVTNGHASNGNGVSNGHSNGVNNNGHAVSNGSSKKHK